MGETPGSLARAHSGLSDLVYEVATSDAHAHVFSVLADGAWERRTAGEFATEVTALAKGLVAAGVAEGDRVLLVDDLIATGGTADAAIHLIEEMGGAIVEACFVIDLPDLGGRRRLEARGHRVFALMEFEGD